MRSVPGLDLFSLPLQKLPPRQYRIFRLHPNSNFAVPTENRLNGVEFPGGTEFLALHPRELVGSQGIPLD